MRSTYSVQTTEDWGGVAGLLAAHKYPGEVPRNGVAVGLYDGNVLVGAAVFTPVSAGVWALTRFGCVPNATHNLEMWFLAQAVLALRDCQRGAAHPVVSVVCR